MRSVRARYRQADLERCGRGLLLVLADQYAGLHLPFRAFSSAPVYATDVDSLQGWNKLVATTRPGRSRRPTDGLRASPRSGPVRGSAERAHPRAWWRRVMTVLTTALRLVPDLDMAQAEHPYAGLHLPFRAFVAVADDGPAAALGAEDSEVATPDPR
jgi:hypothetical protein